jgi:hypothetical protein
MFRQKDEFEEVLENCKTSGSLYFDRKFPAAKKSLIEDWNDTDPETKELVGSWSKYEWKRVSEIKALNENGPPVIFEGKIEPNDIRQGALGDCYFLSVLSVTTENPDRIRKLLDEEQGIAQGAFCVNMTKNGLKQRVVVDDFLPCLNGRPCFSSANKNELWVLILEKAWAKLHGSYERIIGGQSHQTFRDLLGAPGFEFETSKEDAWDVISSGDKKGYILAAGVGQTMSD